MTLKNTLPPRPSEVCTSGCPSPAASLHPDARVYARGEDLNAWPKWVCPHCGLTTELQVDTTTARKILGQP